MNITYKANSRKILEAILYLTTKPNISDQHHIIKLLYYADKIHITKYCRPVTGDTYKRMEYGPVGSKAFDILKQSVYLTNIEKEIVSESLIISTSSPHSVSAKRLPNTSLLSTSDRECLDAAVALCDKKSFNDLCEMVHKEKSWIASEPNSNIDYALMIDDNVQNREEILQYIKDTSSTLEF